MPVETACAAAKVAKRTVYKWLKQERFRVALRKVRDEDFQSSVRTGTWQSSGKVAASLGEFFGLSVEINSSSFLG